MRERFPMLERLFRFRMGVCYSSSLIPVTSTGMRVDEKASPNEHSLIRAPCVFLNARRTLYLLSISASCFPKIGYDFRADAVSEEQGFKAEDGRGEVWAGAEWRQRSGPCSQSLTKRSESRSPPRRDRCGRRSGGRSARNPVRSRFPVLRPAMPCSRSYRPSCRYPKCGRYG